MSKRSRASYQDHAKPFYLILRLFLIIGVYFPYERHSRLMSIYSKVMTAFLNLFSIYYAVSIAYHLHHTGVINGHSIVTVLLFAVANLIRLNVVMNRTKMLEGCKLLIRSKSSSIKAKPWHKLISFGFFINVLVFLLFSVWPYISQSQTRRRVFMLFNNNTSNLYLNILADCLSVIKDWMQTFPPGLILMLLCSIYLELGNLVLDVKTRIEDIVSRMDDGLVQVNRCAYLLCKTSQVVQKIDAAVTTSLFYIMSVLMIQNMVLVSILTRRTPGAIEKGIIVCLVSVVVASLLLVITLASRIPENYLAMKNVLLTSQAIREKLFSGKTKAVSYAGLIQLVRDLESSFYVTAMGALKIEKSAILSMLCACVTYGVIVFQMDGK